MTTSGGETFSPAENDLLLPVKWPASVVLTDGTLPMKEVVVLPDDYQQGDQRVVINVSGLRFETERCTLKRYPHTLLGDKKRLAQFYKPDLGEYFFDRYRSSFESVLHFYQSGGQLRRPFNVPPQTFLDEVIFFDLGDEVVDTLKEEEGFSSDDEKLKEEKKRAKNDIQRRLPSGKVRRYLWNLFEYPDTSIAAKVMTIFSLGMVLLSVATFCVETLPTFRDKHHLHVEHNLNDSAVSQPSAWSMSPFSDPLFHLETVCIMWFSVELALRFFACPDKLMFIRDFMNIIDILSILPYGITLGMDLYSLSAKLGKNKSSNLAMLRTLRLLRVCRILKLSRHSQGLQVLAKTLRASFKEILTLLVFVAIAVVLFASAIYFAEVDDDSAHFSSVPDAFWWAVVTLTTVGYGDMTPVTIPGKIVGAMCALSGVLLIALPVPVIVNNFATIYALQQKENKRSKFKNSKARGITDAGTDALQEPSRVESPERSQQKCASLSCLHGPRRRENLEQKQGPRGEQQNGLECPRETKL